jgi:hypothetical protein
VSSAAPVRAYPKKKRDLLFRSRSAQIRDPRGLLIAPPIAGNERQYRTCATSENRTSTNIWLFRGLQAPVVVSPRSASSSWTTPPVPSSVTSRAQVCDSEFILRLRSPKKNKRRLWEDHIRGGNTRRHIEDPSQPYGEFCLSSATLHEPHETSIANTFIFALYSQG